MAARRRTDGADIADILKGLERTTSRIWVVNRRYRLLALAGSLRRPRHPGGAALQTAFGLTARGAEPAPAGKVSRLRTSLNAYSFYVELNLGLKEPDKRPLLAGEKSGRRVRAMLVDMGSGASTDVIVVLEGTDSARVESTHVLDPAAEGQAAVVLLEFGLVEEIVL